MGTFDVTLRVSADTVFDLPRVLQAETERHGFLKLMTNVEPLDEDAKVAWGRAQALMA